MKPIIFMRLKGILFPLWIEVIAAIAIGLILLKIAIDKFGLGI